MRRVTAACGSMEAKFPTKMEKKDFDRQTDSISRGYQIALSFVGESGATGNGGDYGIMPQPTDAQAALDRPAETVLGPGWHVARPLCAEIRRTRAAPSRRRGSRALGRDARSAGRRRGDGEGRKPSPFLL